MLGKVLRETRLAAGLTQEKLAFAAGVHRTYVSMLERGKGSPTVSVLFDICRALGVLPSELLKQVEAAKINASRKRR